jgi:hypothetical protein
MTAPTACVIAQQHSSATFVSLRHRYPQGRIRRAFQSYYYGFLLFLKKIACLKLRNFKLCRPKSGVIAFPKGTDKRTSPLVIPNIEVGMSTSMKVTRF